MALVIQPDALVNSTTSNTQESPAIAVLTDGRYVITWHSDDGQGSDTSAYGIRARVFNADGTADTSVNGGSDFVVNTTTSNFQFLPAVTAVAGGGFFIAWRDENGDGSSTSIRGRLFDDAGAAVPVNGSANDYFVNTTTTNFQDEPALATLADGRIVAMWHSNDGAGADTSGFGIRARVLNADGTADTSVNAGNDFVVNSTTSSDQGYPQISLLADGRFVATWASYSSGAPDIRARVFLDDGTPDASVNGGDDFVVNSTLTNSQDQPAIATLADGRFVVTWISNDGQGTDTSSYGICARVFLDDGTPDATVNGGGDFVVNTTTNDFQGTPAVAALPGGSFLIVWRDDNGDGSSACIRGRLLAADGTPLAVDGSTGDFIINSTTSGRQGEPSVAVRPDGSVVVTWTDRDNIRSTALDFDDALTTLQSDGATTDTVDEHAANGTLVGILTASHPVPGVTFTFSTTLGGEAGALFTVVDNAGVYELRVANGVALDFEQDATREIIVTATDSNGDVYREVLTINLNDVTPDIVTGTAANETIHGGAGNDVIDGAGGFDTLVGYGGDDTLNAGNDGGDSLQGGQGNDIYIVVNGNDQILENLGEGTDTVRSDNSINLGGYANVENATITSTNTGASINVIGNGLDNVLTGHDGGNFMDGSSGNDTLHGLGGGDTLNGGTGNDTINGGDEGDFLDGGADDDALSGGNDGDTLVGGAGIDSLDGGDGDDTIAGGTGADALDGGIGNDTANYQNDTLGVVINLLLDTASGGEAEGDTLDNVENLFGGSGADTLIGDGLDNTLIGAGGNDDLQGGDGSDLLNGDSNDDSLDGGEGNDTLIDGGGIDHLVGGGGNDLLFASQDSQADTLEGGSGDDELWSFDAVDSLDGGSGNDLYIISSFGGSAPAITELAGGGSDTVRIEIQPISFFPSYVAGTYIAAGNIETIEIDDAFGNVIGNAGDNLIRVIDDGGFDGMPVGFLNNVIDGGLGADRMIGGQGDDTYHVDNVGDVIVEAAFQGVDTVITSFGAYTLSRNVDNLVFTGSGDARFFGNSQSNDITAGAGNDRIDGGQGDDLMIGLGGDDLYIVDSNADVVQEASGGGTDGVLTNLLFYTLDANVENLTYTGTFGFEGHGNSGNNIIVGAGGADILYGGDGIDTLDGLGGHDYLYGDAGADTLNGGSGNDWLFGGAAGDKLSGGTGFDIMSYQGSNAAVNVNLATGVVSGGHAAGDTLTSVEGVRGSGYSDTIVGSSGNNWLAGATGNDTLTGGAGNDLFVFHTALGANNVDRITDFSAVADTVRLDNAIFTAFAAVAYGAAISADAFNTGTGAQDASDRIIYNSASGALLYDADGTGAATAVQFATLSTGLTLTSADFVII